MVPVSDLGWVLASGKKHEGGYVVGPDVRSQWMAKSSFLRTDRIMIVVTVRRPGWNDKQSSYPPRKAGQAGDRKGTRESSADRHAWVMEIEAM
jgi:hypothetical protein